MLADRFGRVRTLQITIVWFAVFTFLCGFSQTYNQLLISRALMGFGFGGEWAAGAVLMGEVIRARHRGKAVGFVQSGWSIGWAVAAILSTLLFTAFPQDIAWRTLFWVGLAPAFIVFFLRRFNAIGMWGKGDSKDGGQGLIGGIKLPGGGTLGDATSDALQDFRMDTLGPSAARGGAVRKRGGQVRGPQNVSPKRGRRVSPSQQRGQS
jgi:MFS family permease